MLSPNEHRSPRTRRDCHIFQDGNERKQDLKTLNNERPSNRDTPAAATPVTVDASQTCPLWSTQMSFTSPEWRPGSSVYRVIPSFPRRATPPYVPNQMSPSWSSATAITVLWGSPSSVVYVLNDSLNRVTLTRSVLLAAKHLVVLVSGAEKARTLKEVLTSEPDEVRYPIHVLWPVLGKVTWLVDRDAARELQSSISTGG